MKEEREIAKIREEITLEGKERKHLLALLRRAQEKFGCVPEEFVARVARDLNLSVSDVYGVAAFYSFLSTRPQGKNVIRICKSLPCFLKNSPMIIESVQNEIGIKPGETTPDGRFSFELTNCIGACDGAPAMLVNDDVHVNLTPQNIPQILKSYK